jgi:hypothetical protein
VTALAEGDYLDRARELNLQFLEPEALQLYAISDKPRYPRALGRARPATIGDATLLGDWLIAFHQEAIPQYPIPARKEFERAVSEYRFSVLDRSRRARIDGGDCTSTEDLSRN